MGVHPVGVDGDWTSNWLSKGDAMSWTVDFLQPEAKYEIGISMRCGTVGGDLKLQVGSEIGTIHLGGLSDEVGWSDRVIMRGAFSGVQQIRIELQDALPRDSLQINALIISMH